MIQEVENAASMLMDFLLKTAKNTGECSLFQQNCENCYANSNTCTSCKLYT